MSRGTSTTTRRNHSLICLNTITSNPGQLTSRMRYLKVYHSINNLSSPKMSPKWSHFTRYIKWRDSKNHWKYTNYNIKEAWSSCQLTIILWVNQLFHSWHHTFTLAMFKTKAKRSLRVWLEAASVLRSTHFCL